MIALQVNNWNQERKDRAKEMEYLQRLRADIQADTLMLSDFLNVTEHKKKFLQSILTGDLKQFEVVYGLDPAYNLFLSRFRAVPNPSDNAFKEMTSSGNLELVKNAELKEKILTYYRYINNRMVALEDKYSDWPKILSQLIPGEGHIFDSLYPDVPNFPKSEEAALIKTLVEQKEELRPHINGELQYTVKLEVSYIALKKLAEELLTELNKEISSRK
ncbi:MAG: hypothetical protein IPJ74_01000 [Saprospiraceae bacterium]|nr:hypothetical protein [Saprospiraceae bacterium]